MILINNDFKVLHRDSQMILFEVTSTAPRLPQAQALAPPSPGGDAFHGAGAILHPRLSPDFLLGASLTVVLELFSKNINEILESYFRIIYIIVLGVYNIQLFCSFGKLV